jgi:hypothetical protein
MLYKNRSKCLYIVYYRINHDNSALLYSHQVIFLHHLFINLLRCCVLFPATTTEYATTLRYYDTLSLIITSRGDKYPSMTMMICVTILLCLSVLVHSKVDDIAAEIETGKVIDVTAENIDEFFSGKNAFLLEFYAPWCGACSQFELPYAKLASRLTNENFR